MSVAAIQNEIPSLSPEERVKLIDLLWDSLSEPELKAREAAWQPSPSGALTLSTLASWNHGTPMKSLPI